MSETNVAVDGNTITITLPDGDQTIVPTIPEELRDHEIPSFVVEWIMESDEIATIIQELLQAPTRSLCREMSLGNNPNFKMEPALRPPDFKSPTPQILRLGQFEVKGFETSESPSTVQGLPTGIKVPHQILEIVAMARKVDAWMWKGMRVTEWAAENGAADASWLPAAD